MLKFSELSAMFGGAFLRRNSLRKLAESRSYLAVIFVLILSILIKSAGDLLLTDADFLPRLLTFLMGFPLLSLLWVLGVVVIIEPALNLMLHLSAADEAEIHWWPQQKRVTRIVCYSIVAIGKLVFSLLSLAFAAFPEFDFVLRLVFITHLYLLFRGFIRYHWNHKFFPATILGIFPLSGCIVVEIIASLPQLIIFLFIILLGALCLFTCKDLILRKGLRGRKGRENKSAQEALHLQEMIHQTGDIATAAKELKRLHLYQSEVAKWFKVRLLSAKGDHLEAIEFGLSHIEEDAANLQLHLAMSEASLGARDSENMIAHAQEALELAGNSALNTMGLEALLFIALGSFSLNEQETGILACERILSITDIAAGVRRKRILKEAGTLLQKFGKQIEDSD